MTGHWHSQLKSGITTYSFFTSYLGWRESISGRRLLEETWAFFIFQQYHVETIKAMTTATDIPIKTQGYWTLLVQLSLFPGLALPWPLTSGSVVSSSVKVPMEWKNWRSSFESPLKLRNDNAYFLITRLSFQSYLICICITKLADLWRHIVD